MKKHRVSNRLTERLKFFLTILSICRYESRYIMNKDEYTQSEINFPYF